MSDEHVPLDPDSFRSVLGRFASGVTVVTARDAAGEDHGMTVSAFCSLSLVPPLILVCVGEASSLQPVLRAVSHFAVNILSSGQEALSRRFSWPESNRFERVGYTRGRTGAPLLDDAVAHLECRRTECHEAGDHTIFIAEVESAQAWPTRPLLYYRGGYAQLER